MKSIESNLVINKANKPLNRLTTRSKIFTKIIQAIQEKKGSRITALDLRKIDEAVADFFIICEADNGPQVKAIGGHIQNEVYIACNESPMHQEGGQSAQWVIIDYANIVVHIMQPETRNFYNLEDLWHDAPQTIFKD